MRRFTEGAAGHFGILMISSLIGVLIIWLSAVDRILMFHTEAVPEADRDTALVTLAAFLTSFTWVWFCWALNLP